MPVVRRVAHDAPVFGVCGRAGLEKVGGTVWLLVVGGRVGGMGMLLGSRTATAMGFSLWCGVRCGHDASAGLWAGGCVVVCVGGLRTG